MHVYFEITLISTPQAPIQFQITNNKYTGQCFIFQKPIVFNRFNLELKLSVT